MSEELEYANEAVTGMLNVAVQRAANKIGNLQNRLDRQVKLVKRLTEELGTVQKERDEWRNKYDDLTLHKADTSNFTSIGDAANNIINNLTVHGFENDKGAEEVIHSHRPIIERAISYVVARAVEQERERILREIEGLFGERDT